MEEPLDSLYLRWLHRMVAQTNEKLVLSSERRLTWTGQQLSNRKKYLKYLVMTD
jgi:hypothetical protein